MNFGGVVSGNKFGLGETSGWGLGWGSGWGSGTIESAVPAVEEKPAEEDVWGFTFGNKAKKGKQAAPATPIEDSVPEPASEPAEEDEAWGWGTTMTSKEKKKGKKYAEEEPPPPPEPEPEPELVDEEPPPPPPEPEPESELVDEEPPVDPFEGLKKSQRKKLERKMRREAEAKAKEDEEQKEKEAERFKEEEEAAAAVATQPPEINGWSYDRGTATTTTVTKDEPAESQGKKGSLSGIGLELRKYVETEGLVCPNQAEHFRGEQIWKNCSLCQSFLSQIADQIACIHYPSG